jgi:regulatory protein
MRGVQKKREAKKLDAEQLWAYALRSIGQRAQTTGEIRAKLRLRAAEPGDIDTCLYNLKEYDFLNDRKFATTFAESRLANQGFGKARSMRDLQARRVAPALAEQTVTKLYAEHDEITLIEAFLRRKYRTADRETLFQEQKDMASAFRRLRMAGFSSQNVVKVLKRFASKPELLDGLEDVED